MIKIKLN